MSGGDGFARFVSGGIGAEAAKRLGLPRPVELRRHAPGAPVLHGPALLVSLGSSRLGGAAHDALAGAGVDVLLADDEAVRPAAVVLDATGADALADVRDLPELLRGPLRRLRSNGRVVVVGLAPAGTRDPEAAAVRQGLEGVVRSLAKELRAGATANLVQLLGEPGTDDPLVQPVALEGALRFLLSGRSAYVDGQPLRLRPGAGEAPSDWDRPLTGRVAVVTGAARGIGAAIAGVLARDGATVVCVDLPASGEALARVANDVGGTALQLDITAGGAAARLVEHLRGRHGGVDVVVHNAGITRDKLLANMKPDAWSSVLDVNLASQLRLDDALLAEGLLRHGGRVVCLASVSGIAGNRGQTSYALSKAGVIGRVRAVAPRFAEQGATVNAVAPGFIETEMTARIPRVTREVGRRLNSLQQGGQPVDVAEAVAWLASPAAAAVNGEVLRVCGQQLLGA